MRVLIDKEPFKIDRNGTEYYHDWTCPRCGGAGGADAWAYTGWTCYECGGTGRRTKPAVIKKYTPEYEQKLAERRAKRLEKKQAEWRAGAEEENVRRMERIGFKDGKAYIILGDTYSIKEELKEAGCRFNYVFGWYSATDLDGYDTFEISAGESFEMDMYGRYMTDYIRDSMAERIKAAKDAHAVKNDTTEFVGEVGKRIEAELTLDSVFKYEVSSYCGYGTDTIHVYKFKDESGNVYVWKTSAYLEHANCEDFTPVKEGECIRCKATVKEHSVYRNEKQTVINRVKVQN